MQAIIKSGAIRRNCYVPGEAPYGYTLGEQFLHDPHIRVPVTHPQLAENMRRVAKKAQQATERHMSPLHFQLRDIQRRLEIDEHTAHDIISKLPPRTNPYDCLRIQVEAIAQKQHKYSVGNTQRAYNAITNLKREVRTTLHVDGEQLGEVDIKASQPALLGMILATTNSQREQTAPDRQSVHSIMMRG